MHSAQQTTNQQHSLLRPALIYILLLPIILCQFPVFFSLEGPHGPVHKKHYSKVWSIVAKIAGIASPRDHIEQKFCTTTMKDKAPVVQTLTALCTKF